MNTADKIKVMQGFLDGRKIQVRDTDDPSGPTAWGPVRHRVGKEPQWDWVSNDYRIAPKTVFIRHYVLPSHPSVFCVTASNEHEQKSIDDLLAKERSRKWLDDWREIEIE